MLCNITSSVCYESQSLKKNYWNYKKYSLSLINADIKTLNESLYKDSPLICDIYYYKKIIIVLSVSSITFNESY
jgi:hypothetical protein